MKKKIWSWSRGKVIALIVLILLACIGYEVMVQTKHVCADGSPVDCPKK